MFALRGSLAKDHLSSENSALTCITLYLRSTRALYVGSCPSVPACPHFCAPPYDCASYYLRSSVLPIQRSATWIIILLKIFDAEVMINSDGLLSRAERLEWRQKVYIKWR